MRGSWSCIPGKYQVGTFLDTLKIYYYRRNKREAETGPMKSDGEEDVERAPPEWGSCRRSPTFQQSMRMVTIQWISEFGILKKINTHFPCVIQPFALDVKFLFIHKKLRLVKKKEYMWDVWTGMRWEQGILILTFYSWKEWGKMYHNIEDFVRSCLKTSISYVTQRGRARRG